jgi:hypothetical protein
VAILIDEGTDIETFNLPVAIAAEGPVLPTVTCNVPAPPFMITSPEFSVSIFRVAFDCAAAPIVMKAPAKKRTINLISFIFFNLK